ncbi:hypothetical protein NKG94_16645 [Micromonospora sp. M12]
MEFSTLHDAPRISPADAIKPDHRTVRGRRLPDASPPTVTEGETSGLLRALSRVPDPRDPRGCGTR